MLSSCHICLSIYHLDLDGGFVHQVTDSTTEEERRITLEGEEEDSVFHSSLAKGWASEALIVDKPLLVCTKPTTTVFTGMSCTTRSFVAQLLPVEGFAHTQSTFLPHARRPGVSLGQPHCSQGHRHSCGASTRRRSQLERGWPSAASRVHQPLSCSVCCIVAADESWSEREPHRRRCFPHPR